MDHKCQMVQGYHRDTPVLLGS